MNIYKKLILVALGIVCVILLVMAIGYFFVGLNTPTTLAGRNMQFMGAYILSISFFSGFLLVTALFVVLFVIWKKKSKKKIKFTK